MKKIIVTGAEGFIGKKLLEYIEEEFHIKKLSRHEFDITDAKSWDGLERYDAVVNLAALTSVEDSWNHPEEYIKTNLNIVVNSLEYCRKNNTKLVIPSSYMYGNAKNTPITETEQVLANNPYALSKKLIEDAVLFYITQYEIDAVVLRLFNIYGEGQSNNFLIKNMIEKACLEKKIIVNDVLPRRDFVHIDDVTNAFKLILLSDKPFMYPIFNICSGESYSVGEIAQKVVNNFPYSIDVINMNKPRKNEIMETLGSSERIYRCYGWKPLIKIDQGLKKLVESEIINSVNKGSV